MLWRAQVRTTALSLLTSALQGAGAAASNADTPIPDTKLPSISVFVDDSKSFDYGGAPEALTTAMITIEVNAAATSKAGAEALLDTLCGLVEDTLFGTPAFVQLFEMIDSCQSFSDYKGAEGKYHFAGATMEIKGHTHETWEPPRGVDLSGLSIVVKSFDPSDPRPAIGAEIDIPTS